MFACLRIVCHVSFKLYWQSYFQTYVSIKVQKKNDLLFYYCLNVFSSEIGRRYFKKQQKRDKNKKETSFLFCKIAINVESTLRLKAQEVAT